MSKTSNPATHKKGHIWEMRQMPTKVKKWKGYLFRTIARKGHF
jgi:hypothetical protein